MKVVRDWRHIWTYFSTQAMALAVTAQVAWANIPPDLRDAVPREWVAYGTAGLLALGIVGRFVKQKDMDSV